MTLDLFLQLFVFATGVAGQILVAHMRKEGFYFWLASNAALIYISLVGGMFGMAALYIFYSYMCFFSISKWRSLSAAKA